MPKLDAERSEGEDDPDEEAEEDESGAEAEGETHRLEVVDDEAETRIKRVRFAAGTRGGSDRKAWRNRDRG